MKNSSSDRIEYAKILKVVFIIFLWYFLMSENEFLMLLKKTRSIYWYPIEFLIWNIRIRTFCIRKNENIHFLYIVSIFHSNIWYQNHLLIRRNIRYLIYKKKPQKKNHFFNFWYKEIPILHHCLYKKERYYIYCIPKILIYHKIRLILCRFIIAYIRQALPVYHKIILSDIRIIIFWINNSIFLIYQ